MFQNSLAEELKRLRRELKERKKKDKENEERKKKASEDEEKNNKDDSDEATGSKERGGVKPKSKGGKVKGKEDFNLSS